MKKKKLTKDVNIKNNDSGKLKNSDGATKRQLDITHLYHKIICKKKVLPVFLCLKKTGSFI